MVGGYRFLVSDCIVSFSYPIKLVGVFFVCRRLQEYYRENEGRKEGRKERDEDNFQISTLF